jgi:ABC-type glycerol-3-phosphate transport system substrate-binding protein
MPVDTGSTISSRRRFLRRAALLPAIALAGAASGCGFGRDLDLATAAPAAAAPGEPAVPGAIELTVRWNGLDPAGQAAAMGFAAGLWADHSISVDPQFTLWSGAYSELSEDLATGKAPDIWQAGGLWTRLLAGREATLLLDDFLGGWSEWPDFYPFAIDDVTAGGNLHGIPYRVNLRSPVIRPGMSAAAGLEPKVPTSWEELNEAAARLTIRDGDGWQQVGFNQFNGSMEWDAWLLEAGPLKEAGIGPPVLNQATLAAAVNQYVHFGADGIMPRGGYDPDAANTHPFCAGQVAIQRLWPSDLANCELYAPDVFDDALVGAPWLGPAGQGFAQVYVDKYMGNRRTGNPDAVLTVLELLSDLDTNYAINIESRRSLPCRVAMESHPIFARSPWREFAAATRYAVPQPTVDEHFDWFPRLGPWIDDAASGRITVAEALAGIGNGLTATN